MRKVITLIIVLVITALAFTYALWDINFHELGRLLSGGDYRVLLPFMILLLLFFWMKAQRWVYILRPVRHFTRAEVTPAMMIGFAGNNILPAHLGELVRVAVFAHGFSLPYSSVAITLLVERIFDLVAILSIYGIGMALVDTPPESLKIGAWFVALLMAGFFATITIILYKPELVLNIGKWLERYLPKKTSNRLNGVLANIIVAFSSLRSPSLVTLMVIWSLLKWSLMVGMIWLSLVAYDTTVSPATTMILMGVITLAAAVPNAPGYIGAIQAAYVFALRPFGVSEEVAFAASVLFLACQWIPVTVAGAVYFIIGGMGVEEVRREMEEADRE